MGIASLCLSKEHVEYTTSQMKHVMKEVASLMTDLLRKMSFLERRQQRQNLALAESAREFQQAQEVGGMAVLCCLCEGCHFYLMANPICGFLMMPFHFLMMICSCIYYGACPCWRKVREEEKVLDLEGRVQVLERSLKEAQEQAEADSWDPQVC